MSYPSASRIDDARRHATALQREGWMRAQVGTIGHLRAAGQDQHYEFCSRLTGEQLDADDRVVELTWDLWYRRRVDAPPPPDVSTCAGQEESRP